MQESEDLCLTHVTAAGKYTGRLLKASCAAQPKGCSACFVPQTHKKSKSSITRTDMLAYDLYEAAKKNMPGKKLCLFNEPKEPDFEANFSILKHTMCTAVLTENFFMDTRSDVKFLQSQAGDEAITMLHVEGIREYLSRSAAGIR